MTSTKKLLYPRVKPTLRILQRGDGSIYVGTVNEGYELDAFPYLPLLRRCTGQATLQDIATGVNEKVQVIEGHLEQLRALGIIENRLPAHLQSESALSRKRQEIEMILASHRSDDGGELEWRSRANFSILVTGDTRVARNLLPLLAASGFLHISLTSESRTPTQFDIKDINALTVTIDELGKNKVAHHRELVRRSQIGHLHTDGGEAPQLVIATSAPRADEIQRWQSDGVAHLALGALVGYEIEIYPLVLPGVTPCLQCIALHKRDALPIDLHPLTFNLSEPADAGIELPVGSAALLASQLLALAIDHSWRIFTGDPLPIEQSKISRVINLLEPIAAPRERRWSFHPECGCVDVRRRAWPR
jgi:hypothetical protein